MDKHIFKKDDFICNHTIIFRSGIIVKRFQVKGSPLVYWATSDSKIFNDSGYEMKQFDPGTGYLMVKIGGIKITVHRLLALLFLPNLQEKETVDHIDRNKRNNHLSNLRWATYSEQAFNRKQRTDTRRIRISNSRTVIDFRSIKDAARFLDRSSSSLIRAMDSNRTIKGYFIERVS